jgi:hypothetical protein
MSTVAERGHLHDALKQRTRDADVRALRHTASAPRGSLTFCPDGDGKRHDAILPSISRRAGSRRRYIAVLAPASRVARRQRRTHWRPTYTFFNTQTQYCVKERAKAWAHYLSSTLDAGRPQRTGNIALKRARTRGSTGKFPFHKTKHSPLLRSSRDASAHRLRFLCLAAGLHAPTLELPALTPNGHN